MSKSKNDWKKREGVVYSTDSNFEYRTAFENEHETLPPKAQSLKVSLDKRDRAGKQVTLISGFVGTAADLENLAKIVKSGCGVGGSTKEGVIIIQGDLREKVLKTLRAKGYQPK